MASLRVRSIGIAVAALTGLVTMTGAAHADWRWHHHWHPYWHHWWGPRVVVVPRPYVYAPPVVYARPPPPVVYASPPPPPYVVPGITFGLNVR